MNNQGVFDVYRTEVDPDDLTSEQCRIDPAVQDSEPSLSAVGAVITIQEPRILPEARFVFVNVASHLGFGMGSCSDISNEAEVHKCQALKWREPKLLLYSKTKSAKLVINTE